MSAIDLSPTSDLTMRSAMFAAHETRTKDGRRVALWTLVPGDQAAHALPVVVGSGFGRRMHHFSPVAMYGAQNGFFVCRYDPVNHVGLSDGDMWDFTLTDSLESLRAAVDWTCAHTGARQVAVIATSLTARVAFELAAQTDRIALVVTAVGVTHVRATLKTVFGDDFARYALDKLPECALFEGKKIGREFVKDAHRCDWWSLEGCIRAMQRIEQPIVNFIGADDTWVDPADVHRAFSEGYRGPRKLLTLDRAPHDLGRDASVARTYLLKTIEELFAISGMDTRPCVPAFEDLMDRALAERRLQRGVADH